MMRHLLACIVAVALLASAPPARAACNATRGALDCDLQQRIASVDAYLATRPGTVGYVLRDRTTGAEHRNAHAGDLIWTASTIKLAMVVDLLMRTDAGQVALTADDRALIAAMLHASDDDAADTLWTRYGGSDHQIFNRGFPRYGMTDLIPQRGFSETFPYWGFQKSTTNDLDRLINYTLTRLKPADTATLVAMMQDVDANQRWGVWGAGQAMTPGNKNGWSLEQGGWVTNSVGFAGPGQRYTLAVMNALGDEGGYDDGVTTTTRLAELLFSGRTG